MQGCSNKYLDLQMHSLSLQSVVKALKLELIPYECDLHRPMFVCDCRSICCCVCRSMLMLLVNERCIPESLLSPSVLLQSEKSKNLLCENLVETSSDVSVVGHRRSMVGGVCRSTLVRLLRLHAVFGSWRCFVSSPPCM
ncbi:hypothetical protein F2Q68_00004534 [Brassica cretica]|uniref:Uncharacterized protein n=1 Tax=Brassica cretica TaxID=69181 RepID=A0A8S9JGW3_BRACR|nr:hypothetical protein F2Q68_00004534 [Brassica cretica]